MADQGMSLASMKDVPSDKWKILSEKKIFFGHQSVGNNIIDGMRDVMKENSKIKFNIVKATAPEEIKAGVFAHAPVGKNAQPGSKIDEFRSVMEKGVAGQVDIAFFKMCYVDISPDTDVEKLFASYKGTLADLKKKYPGVTLVHVTSPLTTLQTGPKAWIKKRSGKPVVGYEDNVKRHAYNELLRKEYTGRAPIFDLATLESTLPDGGRVTFVKDGKTYPYLIRDYTNDGGHLNEKGRKIVAEQFLIFLATLAR